LQNGGTSIVVAWDGEKSDYTFATRTCASGKVCGHYTQVVWAKSKYLGCGYAYCPSEPYKNYWYRK